MDRKKDATVASVSTHTRAISREGELAPTVRAESRHAFSELHASYSSRLYRTIFAITKNREDAEDALQETFLRAYMALHTFEGRSGIYAWLTRIAINSALMVLRRRRARPEIPFNPQPDPHADAPCFEVKDSAPDPEQICDMRQRQTRVLRQLRRLTPELRTPIEMQVAQSSSMKEIGHALNLSEAAVKSRLHRARRWLSMYREFKPLREQAAELSLRQS